MRSETIGATSQRIQDRRRVVVRVGFLALVVATATACIFDKSEYDGGGHLDRGASAGTASATGSTSSAPDASSLLPDGSSGFPGLDATTD